MNRSQLLALLRNQPTPFAGEATLENVKSYIEAEGIDLRGTDGKSIDVDAAWSTKAVVGAEASTKSAEEDPDLAEFRAFKREKVKAVRGTMAPNHGDLGANSRMSPTGMARAAAVKSYNRKAAEGKTSFADADQAEAFGSWARLTLCPTASTSEDLEIVTKANIGTTNTSGGALIPMDFLPQLIDLKEVRGVARQVVPFMPMSRDRITIPRRTGGLTVYAPGEAGAITESNPSVDNVTLTATKMATYTTVSSELLNDSAISFGDMVAREIAYAFADKEDEILFNGDATSTYFGYQGIRHKILNLTATRANIAGLVVASGNAQSEFTIGDYQKVVGRLPSYATNGAYWVVHRQHYFDTMMRVALAAGGATAAEFVNGGFSGQPTFLGYPVKFSQVMPRNDTNDVVFALLGNFGMGVKAGEVSGSMSIATDASVGFASDTIAIRGLQRVGFAVHDVGNESSTAASRVPGPIVGLLSAAS